MILTSDRLQEQAQAFLVSNIFTKIKVVYIFQSFIVLFISIYN